MLDHLRLLTQWDMVGKRRYWIWERPVERRLWWEYVVSKGGNEMGCVMYSVTHGQRWFELGRQDWAWKSPLMGQDHSRQLSPNSQRPDTIKYVVQIHFLEEWPLLPAINSVIFPGHRRFSKQRESESWELWLNGLQWTQLTSASPGLEKSRALHVGQGASGEWSESRANGFLLDLYSV